MIYFCLASWASLAVQFLSLVPSLLFVRIRRARCFVIATTADIDHARLAERERLFERSRQFARLLDAPSGDSERLAERHPIVIGQLGHLGGSRAHLLGPQIYVAQRLVVDHD